MITPQTEHPELARAIGVPRLFLKREDLHPYGSHKGRSIPVMIDAHTTEGAKDFIISGSGNAALAAVRHIQKLNTGGAGLSLLILVGTRMNTEKRRTLVNEIKDRRIIIKETADPLRTLFQVTKEEGKTSLRQSTDDLALIGYESLAEEIEETPELSAVFVGASSGTAAQALADYFAADNKGTAIHIVQTTNTSPIAREFESTESSTEPSLADAIVDKIAHRKNALVDVVRKTNGSGHVATNDDIRKAQKLIKDKADIDVTGNGALGVAGLIHALSHGAKFTGSVVCIITGK